MCAEASKVAAAAYTQVSENPKALHKATAKQSKKRSRGKTANNAAEQACRYEDDVRPPRTSVA
jgi:hypothetical protein|tara:strand:- start:688 stop:876 length:189 start_codon:yes stop_codon:yes gene_type:complete